MCKVNTEYLIFDSVYANHGLLNTNKDAGCQIPDIASVPHLTL